MRREINQHDIVTKKVLGQKTYAVDFLANALPRKITSKLDFSKLKVEKGDFIDADNKERFTDILYSVPTRKTSQRLGIFCLVEHKSTRERDIHSQLLLYLAGIYKTHKWPVVPLVLYHGKEKWGIPTNFASSLEIPEELRDYLIKYIPEFWYLLLDLGSDKMDIGYFSVALQAFLKTLENVWFLSRRSKIKSLFKDYFAPIYKENRKILDDLFDYIICSTGELDIEFVIEIAIKYVSRNAGDKIMTIAEKLEKKGMEKGKAEGKAEKAHEIALGMLKEGISLEVISKITGLSVKQIERLR